MRGAQEPEKAMGQRVMGVVAESKIEELSPPLTPSTHGSPLGLALGYPRDTSKAFGYVRIAAPAIKKMVSILRSILSRSFVSVCHYYYYI